MHKETPSDYNFTLNPFPYFGLPANNISVIHRRIYVRIMLLPYLIIINDTMAICLQHKISDTCNT